MKLPRVHLAHTALLVFAFATSGCGWFGIGKAPNSASNATSEAGSDASSEGTASDGETSSDEGSGTSQTDAGASAAELEEAMAPPDGVIDLRAVFGTDPDDLMPAVFAGVERTSTPDELAEIFPGIGSDTRIYERAKFTRKVPDGNWSALRHGAPHRDLLSISLNGDRVHSLSYGTDPAAWAEGTWAYAKEAAMARWGAPTQGKQTVGFVLTFELEGMTVGLYGGSPGKKELFLTVTFKD